MSRTTPQRSPVLTLLGAAGLLFVLPMQPEAAAGSNGLSAATSNMVRAELVALQLESFSDMSFPVEIHDTGVGGMALSGGQIQVDPWVFMFDDNVVAWLVGHEWGHQALGHVTNPYYAVAKRGTTPTQLEDEADFFAGQFLGFGGYDVDIAADFVQQAADESSSAHSSGAVRAATTRAGYEDFLAGDEQMMEDVQDVAQEPMGVPTNADFILQQLQQGDTTGIVSTLLDEGFDPDDYTNRKGNYVRKKFRKAIQQYYKSEVLPNFDSRRNKKDKKTDIALLVQLMEDAAAAGTLASSHPTIHPDSPFANYQSYEGYGCACGHH
ncbi:MAG: hypothetical protein KDA21_07545 [Phycisphaerales bacterium]|nr:hypothetical protein [Phycisphaerales bacterium]